ncbi:uncharacterized protein LOC113566376 isoform X1 [Drosophila persimilis]|uniref:uncharacterized protein LOC113566376 isoform X1 n=1 Tax=Drosophila persimilis TaxID=7234 RepID=UPI000F094139|nr:uncharacterized protein LOC113566376 isoform X1 [Drosophila persimilis]XP_026847475.1 uncharacterized protein LOC113566376 isoform X2 [Drosophila persimilis]XP_026847476.1 uncharacterized protein LOC113566376 isoform X1 [Drosophila persimilis]
MGVQWISYRRKDELQAIAAEFGLGETGTVDELRSRISAFISRGEHPTAIEKQIEELGTVFDSAPSPRNPRNTSPSPEAEGRDLCGTAPIHRNSRVPRAAQGNGYSDSGRLEATTDRRHGDKHYQHRSLEEAGTS